MSYRDDRDADRARIDALEAELAAKARRIAELEGRQEQALVLARTGTLATTDAPRGGAARWLGAPLELSLTREFAWPFPTDRFEELVDVIRSVVREPGRTELLPSSMTWSAAPSGRATGPFLVVTLSVRRGTTHLTVTDRLGAAAGGIYGGIGGGAGGGTIVAPVALGAAIAPVLIPVFVIGWLGAALLGCRSIFQRVARRRAIRLQQLHDALVREIERTAPPSPP